MVLGLSIGRKSKKKDTDPVIRTSPSLPSFPTLGIPWPENLVDVTAVKAVREQQPSPPPKKSGTHSVSFHKPFRAQTPMSSSDGPTSIAAMYANRAPAVSFPRSGNAAQSRSQRRRVAPTLNIMVAGARGTGKTALLKLFLDTSEIASTSTPEQRNSVESFMKKARKSTRNLQTACVEITESRFDRILLTLIDTPGLIFTDGKELALERSVTELIRYFDIQYDETMGEESKVVRQSKGDQHVHLCIYLIDPDSIVSASQRRIKSAFPTRTRSQATISLTRHDSHVSSEDEISDSEDDAEGGSTKLSMNPAEIRVIKRLSARVNILPVIARADSLIDSRLKAVKATVRRELHQAGIGFGVFAPPRLPRDPRTPVSSVGHEATPRVSIADSKAESKVDDVETASAVTEEEERQARPVIRLRAVKGERSRSRRRSRAMDESPVREDDQDSDQPPMPENAAHLNGIIPPGSRLSKPTLQGLLPFALVSPQPPHRAPKEQPNKELSSSKSEENPALSPDPTVSELEPPTPMSKRSSMPPTSYQGFGAAQDFDAPREFPKGVFIRNYRWGRLDVLDPANCDFIPMRNAILSTHFRTLKTNTREVLYEKYRTDKLLARRATRNISEEERKRLLQDLGI